MLDASRIPSPIWRPYSDASPFNRTILEDEAQVHPDSDAIVSAIVDASFPSRLVFYAGVAGRKTSIGDYYHPIYEAAPSDPLYSIKLLESWGDKTVGGVKIRIPDGAKPAVGGDAHLCVIDGEREADFWRVKSIDTVKRIITAFWGGVIAANGTGTGTGPSTAASFGLAAGVMRIPELIAGEIPHALFLAVPNAPGVVAPAVHRNWKAAAPPLPPLGTRLCLDISDEEIAALDVPEWKQAIYAALAHRGGYIGDQSGAHGPLTGPESSQPYLAAGLPDPLVEFAKAQGIKPDSSGIYAFRFGAEIDWKNKLKVLAP